MTKKVVEIGNGVYEVEISREIEQDNSVYRITGILKGHVEPNGTRPYKIGDSVNLNTRVLLDHSVNQKIIVLYYDRYISVYVNGKECGVDYEYPGKTLITLGQQHPDYQVVEIQV